MQWLLQRLRSCSTENNVKGDSNDQSVRKRSMGSSTTTAQIPIGYNTSQLRANGSSSRALPPAPAFRTPTKRYLSGHPSPMLLFTPRPASSALISHRVPQDLHDPFNQSHVAKAHHELKENRAVLLRHGLHQLNEKMHQRKTEGGG